jgi:hypothetical protein
MCILSIYAIQYLLTLLIHIHLVRFEIIVSVKKAPERINRHIFLIPMECAKTNPQYSFFLSIFTFAAFVLMKSRKHLLTYGDVIRHFYDGKMHKKREDECFSFLFCAIVVLLILFWVHISTSLHALIMLPGPDESFFFMLSFSLSLAMCVFLLFSILCKEKNDGVIFHISLFDVGHFISDSFIFIIQI